MFNFDSKRIGKWLYNHLFIFFLLVSIPLISISYTEIFTNATIKEVMRNFGYAIFSSGVFAAVLKSIQFTGIFKTEIQKVLVSTDYIENVPDHQTLWNELTTYLYNKRFPDISEELQRLIIDYYLPIEKNHYYKNYKLTIVIEELTDDFVIKYKQTAEFEVVLHKDVNSTTLYGTTSFDHDGGVETINELKYFKVNGESVDVKFEKKEHQNGDDVTLNYKVQLKGDKRFYIESKYERQYSIKYGNYKLFRVSTITKNMEVIIYHPDNINVAFYNIGNVVKFEKHHKGVPGIIYRIHNEGVLLPHQGFGISFNKFI